MESFHIIFNFFLTLFSFSLSAQVKVSSADIGGTVSGANGPEAGVWVIAETNDLPTKFAKIVVTDDKGRFLIPELPKANYEVWVRGYGLVDSAKVSAKPGQIVQLKSVQAPTAKAAAQYYPGMYWYSMVDIPKASEFPGTGEKGNGIPEVMKKQYYWVDTFKNSCQSCHAMGVKGIREVPELFTKKANGDSELAWAYRTQAGQAMANMALGLGRMGPERSLAILADLD
jgi:hypothetical protein